MTRVYLGHIPYEIRERDIERFFKGYGRIRDILLKRGYAFIEFGDSRDADDAVYDLNGRSLMGMRAVVEVARSRPYKERGYRGSRYSRSSSRSRSRGRRDRSRSRSRSRRSRSRSASRDSRSRSRSASSRRSARSESPAPKRSRRSGTPPRSLSRSPRQNGAHSPRSDRSGSARSVSQSPRQNGAHSPRSDRSDRSNQSD